MLNPNDWPAELDALAAAPENHTLLFENDAVRVLDTLVRPSQVVPLHTHQWPSANYLHYVRIGGYPPGTRSDTAKCDGFIDPDYR